MALCRIEQEQFNDALELLDKLIASGLDETMLIAARCKKAYAHLRAGSYEEGLALARETIPTISYPDKHSDVTMFFDESFRLLRERVAKEDQLLPLFSDFCNWWISVLPQHPSIKQGRFFQQWAIAYRNVGDWEQYQRVLNQAISSGLYKGRVDVYRQMCFALSGVVVGEQRRLRASKAAALPVLYMDDLFGFRKFKELRHYIAQLEEHETWPQYKSTCLRLQKDMLEIEGDLDALKRHLGSAVLTSDGRLSLARCHLLRGEAQEALALLELDWNSLEERLSERNPIGQKRWRIAFSCFAMLNDRESAVRLQSIANRYLNWKSCLRVGPGTLLFVTLKRASGLLSMQ